jgi:hypothetical protein
MTTARPHDTTVTRLIDLERQVAELLAWKASVEAAMAPAAEGESEDGMPRKWLPLAEAAAVSGRSIRGLRNLMKQKRLRVRYRGPHPTVDVTSIPTRCTG